MRRSLIAIVLVAGTAASVTSLARAQSEPSRPAQASPRAALPVRPLAAHGGDALPIRAITLYRSGVGYFERSGKVAGDDRVSLRIDKDVVNDILKSLVLLDVGGGGVSAVGYGSKEPLLRRLESFGVNIADNPSMADLMTRLRGARVRLTTAEGPVEGAILGTEMRNAPAPRPIEGGGAIAAPAVPEAFINIVTANGVKSVAVSRVNAYELLDERLSAELNLALVALAESRDERSATIDLAFTGAGERAVALGYVHETPVWKTTYRLTLPEDSASGEAKPRVQGWAIVENTTDEDWREVRLSLASGNPVGFRMDLHEPLFVDRPTLPVPTTMAARARLYESVEMPFSRDDKVNAGFGPRREAKREAALASPASAAMDLSRRVLDASGEMVQTGADMARYKALGSAPIDPGSQSQATDAGEAFRYELRAPVSIERRRSAMLPILGEALDARRVSIYNASDNRQHPMRGVELTNTTGFELTPGPISVFDGAGYAGDAQIGFTSRGQQRLLSYAVDLDVRVLADQATTDTVVKARIVGGMVEQQSVSRATTSYTLINRDGARDRVVLLEQAKRPGWDLRSPEKPSSVSEALNRFEVSLAKAEQKKYDVVEERTNWSRSAVASFDLPTILAFAQDGKASAAVADAVRKAATMQAGLNDLQAQAKRIKEEVSAISTDQSRIRSNMQTISKTSDLYANYMTKLTEQETRLERLAEQAADIEERSIAAKAALDAYIADLNVE